MGFIHLDTKREIDAVLLRFMGWKSFFMMTYLIGAISSGSISKLELPNVEAGTLEVKIAFWVDRTMEPVDGMKVKLGRTKRNSRIIASVILNAQMMKLSREIIYDIAYLLPICATSRYTDEGVLVPFDEIIKNLTAWLKEKGEDVVKKLLHEAMKEIENPDSELHKYNIMECLAFNELPPAQQLALPLTAADRRESQ